MPRTAAKTARPPTSAGDGSAHHLRRNVRAAAGLQATPAWKRAALIREGMESMSVLKDKVALVTGSARGIGKGCALELARRGADVVINDRDHLDLAEQVAAEVRRIGRRAVVVPSDVTDRTACGALVDRAAAEFGRLDIVVANAAFSIRKPFLELEEAEAAATFAGTFWSGFHVTQLAARQMAKQGRGGSIIFISSVLAVLPAPTKGTVRSSFLQRMSKCCDRSFISGYQAFSALLLLQWVRVQESRISRREKQLASS